jgi:hypothetical protein
VAAAGSRGGQSAELEVPAGALAGGAVNDDIVDEWGRQSFPASELVTQAVHKPYTCHSPHECRTSRCGRRTRSIRMNAIDQVRGGARFRGVSPETPAMEPAGVGLDLGSAYTRIWVSGRPMLHVPTISAS